ncbi:ATP-binding protein [Streptomyces sp. NPDC091376]|uniref:ATP-binding protein n=1 Tax=Streptomyces sp. NPDC091376 TaxID=3365994 RepID=UPI00380108DA
MIDVEVGDPGSFTPGTARERTLELLRATAPGDVSPQGSADRCETALLVVSELVTNAVKHGRGVTAMRFRWQGPCLRIEVSDYAAAAPAVLAESADREGGRGMSIVSALCEDWGVRHRSHDLATGGKTVFATLRFRDPGFGEGPA